jgi:nicotinate-nucleotide adenylyltransferase
VKIGLFGGSFDPIHRGHLEPVRQARAALGLERVIYLPTARPPHKGERHAPALARFAMVELALLGEEGLYASPFEMRDAVCYTVDSVEHFRRELPGAELVLLIGADSWASFTTFRSWARILDLAELAVMVRPGWESGEMAPRLAEERARGGLRFVANEPCPVSSRELRERLRRGEDVSPDQVPPLVIDYLRKYGLYRSS